LPKAFRPIVLLAAFAALAGAPSLRAQAPVPLFRAVEAPARKAVPAGDGVLRYAWIGVDLDRLLPRDPSQLKSALDFRLDLFEDAAYTARLEPEPSRLLPYVVWRGPIDGIEGSQVLVVAGGGQIAASIDAVDHFYRVRYSGEPGVHALEEMGRSGALGEQLPLEFFKVAEVTGIDDSAQGAEVLAAEPIPAPPDDGSVLDLLVVYTPQARAEMGDDPVAIRNLIALGIAALDTTLVRSGVSMRARLVQAAEVAYEEDPDVGVDLDRLRRRNDAFLEEVHALRDRYHADIVSLVRGTRNCATPLQCGRSILMPGGGSPAFAASAFNVIAVDRVNDGTYALAHEIGHNFGCNHAPDDPTGVGAFDYSYGYKNARAGFSTLMAYWCGDASCPKVLQFSNPDVSVYGYPTGTESQNNARSIQNVREILANFRVSAPPPATGGTCRPKRGPFLACQGSSACSVCALKIAAYPRYLLNHPDCNLNTACSGKRFQSCSRSCPAPTNADR
jgi:hypothetical protein